MELHEFFIDIAHSEESLMNICINDDSLVVSEEWKLYCGVSTRTVKQVRGQYLRSESAARPIQYVVPHGHRGGTSGQIYLRRSTTGKDAHNIYVIQQSFAISICGQLPVCKI